MSIPQKKIIEICNTYYDDVYKYCFAKCRNIDDALDLTQSTFLVFLKKAQNIDDYNIKAWLIKAASLEVKKYYSRKAREITNNIALDDCPEITYVASSDNLSTEDFEDLLNETQKKIISCLSEKEKTVFIKLYIEKKDIRIVSNETGLSPENIYVKSHNIRKKAKKVISTTEFVILLFLMR